MVHFAPYFVLFMPNQSTLPTVKDSMSFVTSVGGYDEMAVEIFYESLVDFLEGLTTHEAMHRELTQENSTSDYCTWYLRVLTATFLKADPTRFEPFLEDGYYDIATFCQQQIEPMGKECSMVAEAFQVKVEIEYLDGREFTPRVHGGNGLTMHTFGSDTSATTLRLLYRPGHYDILYSK
jgi:ubiquitin thioesterase protein OTUB1